MLAFSQEGFARLSHACMALNTIWWVMRSGSPCFALVPVDCSLPSQSLSGGGGEDGEGSPLTLPKKAQTLRKEERAPLTTTSRCGRVLITRSGEQLGCLALARHRRLPRFHRGRPASPFLTCHLSLLASAPKALPLSS